MDLKLRSHGVAHVLIRSFGYSLNPDKLDRFLSFFFFFVFLSILGLHPQHVEVPRLGVISELQLLYHSHSNARSEPHL